MRRSEVSAFLASLLSVLLVMTPVSAQPSGSEGGVDAAAPSAEVYEYYGSPPSEDPIVVENGEIRSDGDIRVGCLQDYRLIGARQSRACYEAGYAPLDYPGPDAEGPFPPYPGPGGAAAPASSPAALPDTGGPTPTLLAAGALVAISGLLVRRGTRARTRGGAARPPGGS